MKRFLLVLLAVAVVVNFAFGQTPKTKSGDRALLFTLNGLSNIGAGNFNGGVGVKYYISNGTAIRGSIGFGSSSTTTKNPQSPVPAGEVGEAKTSSTSFSISPGIQYNMVTTGPIVGFVGAQVTFSTSSAEQNNPGPAFDTDEKHKQTLTTFGAGVLAGFEWFPWDNISVGAEYQLSFSTGSGKNDDTSPAGTSTSLDVGPITNIGLGSGSTTNLTLAVYL